jgi:hypothetical protein
MPNHSTGLWFCFPAGVDCAHFQAILNQNQFKFFVVCIAGKPLLDPIYWLLVNFMGWCHTKHPKLYGHFLSIVHPHLCSNTLVSSSSVLWLHQRHLAMKQESG